MSGLPTAPPTGVRRWRARSHIGPVAGVALTSDGRLLTAAYDRVATLWRVDADHAHRPVPHASWAVSSKNVNCAAAAPGRDWLATGASDGVVALFHAEAGRGRILAHPGDVECLAFSDDADRLASGGTDGTVRVWSTANGCCLAVLPHGKTVAALRFLPDGRLATVANDGCLRIWNAALTACTTIALSPLPLKSLALGDRGLLVGGHDATIRWVDERTGAHDVVARLSTTPKSMASDGGTLVVAAYDDRVYFADLRRWAGGALRLVPIAQTGRLWAHAVDVRGDTIASGSFDGGPLLWRRDTAGWLPVRTAPVPVPCISSLGLAADGTLISGGDSGRVRVGRRTFRLDEAITSVRPCPGGDLVVATWSGRLHRLDRAGAVRSMQLAEAPIVCAEVREDEAFAGLYSGGVIAMDLASGTTRWHNSDATGAVKSVDADRELVAVVGRYDPLRLLDRRSGRTWATLPLETAVSDAVRFGRSATGEVLLALAAGPHEVWFVRIDAANGSPRLARLWRSAGHTRPIKAIAWIGPGRVLAGDYAGNVLEHSVGAAARPFARVSPILGVSAIVLDGARVRVATFDGQVVSLPLRVQA